MTRNTPRELFDKAFISEEQYHTIDQIHSGKIVSVFYELRSLLYFGVLLFTTGAGLLIYENIGQIGHLISIGALILLTLACFWYAFSKAPAYSAGPVKGPTPYFDYIILLGSLLFISVLGYLQFQFGFLEDKLEYVTLITSVFFFYVAYRFDHLGVLSMAITAMASFWSISISPQKWYRGELTIASSLHNTAIVFGVCLIALALLFDRKLIKKHFTFTYLNFGCLIFFIGAISGQFIGRYSNLYLLLIYGGCVFAWYMARQKKSFLFLLYAFVAAYIGTTWFLTTIMNNFIAFWYYYSILSCGGFIFFIVRYKNYFNRTE